MPMKAAGDLATGMFRSLHNANYRLWAGGALVSNIGSWMQRTAQDWLVLTQLTHHNATAMGIVTALQFGPQIVLLPLTGLVADYVDRRRLLMFTQGAMGLLALALGMLTITGLVQLWHVYVFAFLLGCVGAFDAPARQTFVGALVKEADLSNAVALNSTSFNAARLVGPALAGALIELVGSGWLFLLNAVSFMAVIASLACLRLDPAPQRAHAARPPGSLAGGFVYVWHHPELKTILLMIFLVGTFGLNFPIFISTMAVMVFHSGAGQYGLLSAIMAVGSVAGALLAARRLTSGFMLLFGNILLFSAGLAIAALMPSYLLFSAALVVIGMTAQTLTTTALSLMQLSTEPAMRGRVMAIFLAVALGGTPVGALIIGWSADKYGPRWGMGIGSVFCFTAALVGLFYLIKYRHLRLRIRNGRPRLTLEGTEAPDA